MPLVPCPQCRKGVQVAAGSTGTTVRCGQCGSQFTARVPGGQPRPDSSSSSRFEISDHLPMIGILAGSALLIVTMCCGIGVWLIVPDGPQQAADDLPLVRAAPDTPISREPQPGYRSWVPEHPLAAADKGTWKVQAEPNDPPPGLLTVFPLPYDTGPGVVFSSGSAARAGVLQPVRSTENERNFDLVWSVFDLRQVSPVASVKTFPQWPVGASANLPRATMSQSGKLVAVFDEMSPFAAHVWSDDGSKVCSINPEETEGAKADPGPQNRKFLFLGDSLLAIDTRKQLIVYQLPSGKEVWRRPAPLDTHPLATCGGKWLAQASPKSLQFFAATDGSPAGTIELGDHWKLRIEGPPLGGNACLALHPSGRSIALLAFREKNIQDVMIAHFDLATGAPLDQVVIPNETASAAGSFWTYANWRGDRMLQFTSGQVVDLNLRTFTCRYEAYGLSDSPDFRHWKIASFTDQQAAAVAQKLNLAKLPSSYALVAMKMPDERVTGPLEQARDNLLLHPGFRFTVESDESVPEEYRQTLLNGLADGLAIQGFGVDPRAQFRVIVCKAAVGRTPNLAFDGRKFFRAEATLEIADRAGNRVDGLTGSASAQADGKEAAAWVALAEELKTKFLLPRIYRGMPGGGNTDTFLPPLKPGIEGFFTPEELN